MEVSHGGIDGYSRLIVYLHRSDNNRVDTVLHLFVEAIQQYGCPSHVRGDQGGENTSVADYMISERGPGRGSYIPGKSVHNERIEHLWRDVFTGCTVLFYHLFNYMEATGFLDPDDKVSSSFVLTIYLHTLPQVNKENIFSMWARKSFVFGSIQFINDHPRISTTSSSYSSWRVHFCAKLKS